MDCVDLTTATVSEEEQDEARHLQEVNAELVEVVIDLLAFGGSAPALANHRSYSIQNITIYD